MYSQHLDLAFFAPISIAVNSLSKELIYAYLSWNIGLWSTGTMRDLLHAQSHSPIEGSQQVFAEKKNEGINAVIKDNHLIPFLQ